MATKLYLHNVTNNQPGTYPSGEQSNFPSYGGSPPRSYSMSTASTLRKMNTTIGSGQVSPTFISLDNTIDTQEVFLRMWTSPPLDGNQTVGGGNFTLNLAHAQSNNNMNLWRYGVNIYVWRPSTGTKIGTIKAVLTINSIIGTEPSSASSERVWHVSGTTSSAISAQNGDVVILELYVDFIPGMSTSYTGTLYYDGTTENSTVNASVSNHASYIQFAENLVFQSPPSNRRVIIINEP